MKNILKEKHTDNIFGSRVERMRLVEDKDVIGKKVLDVGCGFGWCAWNLLQRGVGEFVGIDITEDAKKAFGEIKDKRIKYVQAGALDLPFKSKFFDTVVSWETIEHVPVNTERQMLLEIYRVLKPGGTFYLSTQHRSFVSTVLDPAWWLVGHRHYTLTQIEKMITEAGFKIEKLYTKGGLFTVSYMLNLYITKWALRRNPFFEKTHKEKCTKEFNKKDGFTNIFLKCKKVVGAKQ